MLFAWWKGFEALPPNFNKLPKHLLCFCFLLPINLCVLRPFQGALWHAKNLPTIPYSFILPILPVNCSSLVSSSLTSLYARHQSNRTDTQNSILNSLSGRSLTEVFSYITSWQNRWKVYVWLLDCYRQRFGGVRVDTWLALGRFAGVCEDVWLVQRLEHAYRLIACLASVYWVHTNRWDLRVFI